MENATKALLIAAAVLIAILVISLGLVIYNKASETVSGAGDLTEYQIQQANEKFIKYEGSAVLGSEVNALLQTVLNHNNSQADASTCVKVDVKEDTTTDVRITKTNQVTASPKRVNTGARYTVQCQINATTKLVDQINVTINS